MRELYVDEIYRNTASKDIKEINKTSYVVMILKFGEENLKVPQELAFVVSKERGHRDYLAVRNQPRSPKYSSYGQNLLNAMFRNW